MRTEKELIQLLIDSEEMFDINDLYGLCALIAELYFSGKIDKPTSYKMRGILSSNVPKKVYNDRFFFHPRQWQPRKEYLKNLLKKYE